MALFGIGRKHHGQRHYAARPADTFAAVLAATARDDSGFTQKDHDAAHHVVELTSKGSRLTYGDRFTVSSAPATGGTMVKVEGAGATEFAATSPARMQKEFDRLFSEVYAELRRDKKFIG